MKAGDQVVKALRRVGNDNGTPVFNRFIDDEVVTKRVSGDKLEQCEAVVWS